METQQSTPGAATTTLRELDLIPSIPLGWGRRLTIGVRLPNDIRPVLLDVLVLELRMYRDGDSALRGGAVCRRESDRLAWVP